jgi:3-hydroxyisobutyrate dehydrogenase-like beta-hydroxyacid dehydrogenase
MRATVAGMGRMGSALADALLQSGIAVTVWNRTAERCRALVEAGASQARTLAEAAAGCDVLVSCLSDHQAVGESVTTPAVGEALAGKTLVQLSQATQEQSLAYADWAAGHGIDYLDGSILAYPKDMRAGACDVIYSGDPAVYERCLPVLKAMGSQPRLVGERPGVATAFDKAYFAFYYAHAIVLIHGAAICRAAGVPLDAYLDLMVEHYDWRAADRVTAAALVTGDMAAREASLDTHAYAYKQVAPFSHARGVETDLTQAIDRLFATGSERGLGDDEIAAFIEVFHPLRDEE